MRILTARQAERTGFDCDAWSSLSPNASRADLSDRFVHDVYEAKVPGDFLSAVDALLAYRIFSPRIMRAQVCTADRRVALGSTIIQRVFLGPLAVECAVRVIEFESGPDRASFTYATLPGHPEHGIESFAVTRASNKVRLEIHGWSRPGHWLTLVGRPLGRALQLAMTRDAVAAFPRA